jgi:hypothetical protein
MKITVSSAFNLSFEQARQLILRPDTMQTVASPMMRFRAVSPKTLPEQWEAGKIYRIKLFNFGFIPLGWYDIKIEIDQDDKNTVIGRDRGHGQIVNIWNHAIIIKRDGDKTRYSDEVDVHAGLFTPLIALYAQIFYRHRQNRWKRIVIPAVTKATSD